MKRTIPWRTVYAVVASLLIFTALGGYVHAQQKTAQAALGAPILNLPLDNSTLSDFGPTLSWTNPSGVTQVHLQVIPANNDGPGIDLHVGSSITFFQVQPPPQWYGLLPDMTYTWRVRVSDASDFVKPTDASWGAWSEGHFRTPAVSSSTISIVSPSSGSSVTSLTPTLTWANSRSDVFYYEVQLSKDATFNTNAATATAMVYGALIHGGVTTPPNSYAVPANAPLEPGVTYYWRVRPRVQGDGMPAAWSQHWDFRTPAPLGKIAFVSHRDGSLAIYTVGLDGADVTRLASGCCARWAPDSTRLAFTCGSGTPRICVINKDGTGLKELAAGSSPEWSLDGANIAFNCGEVCVIRADGSHLKAVSQGTGHSPSWSPDGTKIAFVSDREGRPKVYAVSVTGEGLVNLTQGLGCGDRPAWSPKGSKIAFVSGGGGPAEGGYFCGSAVYVMNADGSAPTRLADAAGASFDLKWSPNGNWIAFWSTTELVGSMDHQIYIVNTDGTGLTRLGNGDSPGWSPDGTKIVFSSVRDAPQDEPFNGDIYLMNSDGSNVTRLTNHPAGDCCPEWSPR